MNRIVHVFAAILAISASCAVAQTSGPVAYIYVSSNYSGSNNRVVGYAANADGQLTQISGSPWPDNLYYLATSGSYLFGTSNVPDSVGKNIFSYSIGSNGALHYVGATNIRNSSSDNACDYASDLLLDHTGSYLYIYATEAYCNSEAAYVSYGVNKSNGTLNYLGVTPGNAFGLDAPLTMAADNLYAYSSAETDQYGTICVFKKQSDGSLADDNGQYYCDYTPWPTGTPGNWNEYGGYVTADPTNHLAMNIVYYDQNGTQYNKIQTIAIDTTNGELTSSSTFSNMPDTDVQEVTGLKMSPSGKLLAVGGSNGIQIFNFNPSGQASQNTGLITSVPITQMYWDNSNHLYAISNADNAIHVFTVTPTSTTEGQGSPWSVPHPVALAGNSMSTSSGGACSAPSSDGVNVCSPSEGASLGSPLQINAAANVSGGVYRFSLWNGSTKLLSEDNGTMDQTISLASGTYKLTFDARNSSGTHAYATRDITVSGGAACTAPTGNGINVCSPAEGATVSSPLQINAAATISGGIYRFSLWNGSTKLLSEGNGTMNQTISLAPGTYKLTFDARDSSGTHEYATRDVTVQ
jgi:6-phosphogluconolactonase (cycloisomerase 2 family)